MSPNRECSGEYSRWCVICYSLGVRQWKGGGVNPPSSGKFDGELNLKPTGMLSIIIVIISFEIVIQLIVIIFF